VYIGDASAVESINVEENRSVDGVVRHWNEIPPYLALTINCAASIDVDILATENEEARRVLEGEFERIGLPIGRVIRELNCTFDIYRNDQDNSTPVRVILTDVDAIKER
jgi:hypothetical protein